MDIEITDHCKQRMEQRGFREDDLVILLLFGTTTKDGVVLRRRDASNGIRQLRRLEAALERLEGAFVVIDGCRIVTIYRPTKKKMRVKMK